MTIGVFRTGWWKPACQPLDLPAVELPVVACGGNDYAADVAARLALGAQLAPLVQEHAPALLLDNGGAGLAFIRQHPDDQDIKLAHEVLGKPLYSHFIDPLVTCFQGLPWPLVWQCLYARTWVKAVWDKAQAVELRRMGVPNVVHLPMAAPDRAYNTDPLDPAAQQTLISFVGSQNTTYFSSNMPVQTGRLVPGLLAHAARADRPASLFYEVFHDLYGVAAPITADDPMPTRVQKALDYFNAKLFYNAALCIRNRDRFVIFLKKVFGEKFMLVGQRWDRAYGLTCAPPIPTDEGYLDHFRTTAININLVNGNAETGLNMRHFEITAAGGFMLCYDQPEVHELFDVGRECVVFNSEHDLLEKVRYYLQRPQERVAIAHAGQRRTLSQHLYSHRLKTLLDLATGTGAAGTSTARPAATKPGTPYDDLVVTGRA